MIKNISNIPVDKINIKTDDNASITFDDATQPVLDYDPTKKLRKWQQDIINNIDKENYCAHNANAVHDPTSKLCLECKDLLKTS